MIPVYQPEITNAAKQYVNQCLDSSWISSKGEFVNKFEQSFSDFIQVPFSTTVCNGTVALHLALMSLNLGEGDEVIVPTFTYIASINTIMQTGATPVYVDSLMETWQMDPTQIAKKITPKTKAIMVVHLYGAACNMDAIMQIAKKHRLLVIEDCAESFGTYYNKQHTGTFGDVATFSFFGNKTITTGEGGMVCCKDPKRYERLITLKNQGICNLPNQTVQTHEYLHHGLAFNYRMTNICAAIGLAQLERAPETLAKKRTLASHYKKFLADLPLITHAEYAPVSHSFWMCSILVENEAIRNGLRTYLRKNGIETRPGFLPGHQIKHCRCEKSYPIAEFLSKRIINLPSWPNLSEQQIVYITDTIKRFYSTMQNTQHTQDKSAAIE